jgi:two-component system, OmpR family, sensor histidine kinase TctE
MSQMVGKVRSIKRDLLLWLLLPLCFLSVLCTAVAYALASAFANDAYDRNLINTADSVAARVRIDENGKYLVDLPPAAQQVLRHTHADDKLYYQVLTPGLAPLGGDQLPTTTAEIDSNIPQLRTVVFNGEKVRLARIRIPLAHDPDQIILVQAAETLKGRTDLTHQILISILFPQVLSLVLGYITVSFGVQKGLVPLSDLRSAVVERSKADLDPLDESIAPLEAQPLASAINDLLGRLRADLEAQRRFVANAAHQLRTPLAGIKTYVEIMQRASTDSTPKNLLTQIDKGIDRMGHLVTRLLALAKADPHAIFEFADVDLNMVASEATSPLIGCALEKQIELSLEPANQPAIIYGDANNLKELAANLVENAILYTPEGGAVSVSVINGEGVSLIVQDNGPGIAIEERERVFERFYRVLGTQVEGSGLGLAIVKEIATTHDASVTLAPGIDGKGSKFVVTFPDLKKSKFAATRSTAQ